MTDPMERVPPQAIDAERAVLGALMMTEADVAVMADVGELLKPISFYKAAHECIFQACLDLSQSDTAIDLVTMARQLKDNGELERVGGVPYLNEIMDSCPTAANAVYYAEIVRDAAIRRYLVIKGAEISNDALDDEIDTEAVIAKAEKAIMDVRAPESRRQLVPVKTAVVEAFNHVKKLYETGESIIGLSTGFGEIDRMFSGWQAGQYIVIGGRPGMGKSAFVQNIIYNAGVKQGEGCVMFSVETSSEAFTLRLLSQASQIELGALRSGHIRDTDFPALVDATSRISNAPIWIDDTGGISPSQMRQRLRQVQRHMEIKLIVLDYMQLMLADERTNSPVEKLTNISLGLKNLAKEFGCPLVAVSQLSRKVEERPDKRPQLSDLRESGAIEQDADGVLLLCRPGYYFDDPPERTEVIVAKNKDGATGVRQFIFNMKKMTFKEGSW